VLPLGGLPINAWNPRPSPSPFLVGSPIIIRCVAGLWCNTLSILLRYFCQHAIRIDESQNTQSPRLRFRALLADDGDPRVQLHRA
jgi:hypothetical protein